MRTVTYGLMILCALFLIAACSGPAEDPQSEMTEAYPEEPRASEPYGEETSSFQEIEGELISVRPEDQELTVRTDDGQEIEVTYSSRTEVIGSLQGTQGLATVQGSRVRISYEEGMLTNTAVWIQLEPMTTG